MINDCHSWSAVQIASAVSSGQLSAREVVQSCLDRTEAVNPAINAFAIVDSSGALSDADTLDQQIAAGRSDLPLAGVPFHVKDVIPTKGIETAYGSHTMVGNIPGADVTPIAQLKHAGAILIGKTTTPEYASSVITASPRYGTTFNPWNLQRTPGGSSGGTAAALAAGLAPIGVSTDGAGSARIPASCCGVLGLKPTLGLVANDYWPVKFDIYSYTGMNTRTADDLAALLTAVNGPSDQDPWTIGRSRVSYRVSDDPVESLRGLKILHVPRMGNQHLDKDTAELQEDMLVRFSEAGAIVTVLDDGFDWAATLPGMMIFATLHARLNGLLAQYRDVMDPNLVAIIEAGAKVPADALGRAPIARTDLFLRVQKLFESADLLISPTLSAPPPRCDHKPDEPIMINGLAAGSLRDEWYTYPRAFNFTGHPAISIPMGFTSDGLPAGMQVVARYYGEQQLLDVAGAVEVLKPWADKWPALVTA